MEGVREYIVASSFYLQYEHKNNNENESERIQSCFTFLIVSIT
jgi:hypothetical protein